MNIYANVLALKRYLFHDDLVVVVGSSWKVGSTWLYNIVRDLCSIENAANLPEDLNEFGTLRLECPGAIDFLINARGYNIYKTHSNPPSEGACENVKFLSIYRDPRDVIISSIFYLANISEEEGGWGEGFKNLSEKNRIKKFIEEADVWITKSQLWVRHPQTCQVRYEDLKTAPEKEIRRVLEHLGLKRSDRTVKKVIARNSFRAKSGRNAGQEHKGAVLRKGIVGDWKNYYDEECIMMFKQGNKGRWNQMLVEMGYEKTLDW